MPPYPTVDNENALEEVLDLLERPPAPGSAEDARLGARLRQVIAASIQPEAEDDPADAPTLTLDNDLRTRLERLARRREADKPFGDHPEGIGPTLGMDLRSAQ